MTVTARVEHLAGKCFHFASDCQQHNYAPMLCCDDCVQGYIRLLTQEIDRARTCQIRQTSKTCSPQSVPFQYSSHLAMLYQLDFTQVFSFGCGRVQRQLSLRLAHWQVPLQMANFLCILYGKLTVLTWTAWMTRQRIALRCCATYPTWSQQHSCNDKGM